MTKKVLIVLAMLTLIGGAVSAQNGRSTTETKSRYPQDFRLVRINGNQQFALGDSNGNAAETYRTVAMTGSYYVANYPVTVWEFYRVMPNNYDGGYVSHTSSGLLPMHGVSWHDAIEYCNRRSRMDGLTPVYTISGPARAKRVTWNKSANGWRLLTDAEWEIACRAGTTTRYSFGNSLTSSQANFNNSRGPTPVGQYRANAWGIYDMHGNVWEWCWDWYGSYSGLNASNPQGPERGELTRSLNGTAGLERREDMRVIRGGSWNNSSNSLLSGWRNACRPAAQFTSWVDTEGLVGQMGFRIARNAN